MLTFTQLMETIRKLENANAPNDERSIVIAPKFEAMMRAAAELTPAPHVEQVNGYIGNSGGLAIYVAKN